MINGHGSPVRDSEWTTTETQPARDLDGTAPDVVAPPTVTPSISPQRMWGKTFDHSIGE